MIVDSKIKVELSHAELKSLAQEMERLEREKILFWKEDSQKELDEQLSQHKRELDRVELLDEVREVLRSENYSYCTEKFHIRWMKSFLRSFYVQLWVKMGKNENPPTEKASRIEKPSHCFCYI